MPYGTSWKRQMMLNTKRKNHEISGGKCSLQFLLLHVECLHPKENIHPYFSYYDKRTGLSTGFDSALSKLSAIKAQISIAERKEKEYIEYQRANNLFFDELTDGQLLRFREKLRMKKEKHAALKQQIRSEVEAISESECDIRL